MFYRCNKRFRGEWCRTDPRQSLKLRGVTTFLSSMTNACQKKRSAVKKGKNAVKMKPTASEAALATATTVGKESSPKLNSIPPRLRLKLKLGNLLASPSPATSSDDQIRSSITPPPPLSKTDIAAAKKAVNDLLGNHKAAEHTSSKPATKPKVGSIVKLLDAKPGHFEENIGFLSEDERRVVEEQIESGMEDEDTPTECESEGKYSNLLLTCVAFD